MQLSDLQRQLIGTFFDESADGLDRLESGLLAFGGADAGPELIHDLFRVVHNMKGGAATFGLSAVTELAHVMETAMDQVRHGALAATPEIGRLLLEGVDACRTLLNDAKAGAASDAGATAALRARLQAVAGSAPASPTGQGPAPAPPPAEVRRTYDIRFRPAPNLLDTGNEPICILRELAELGEASIEVDASGVPELAAIDPERLYLAWDVALTTTASEAQVREVFAWVEGDAEIGIELRPVEAAPEPVKNAPPDPRQADPGGQGSIRVAVDKIDLLMNMVGELVITQSMLGELDADGSIDERRLRRLQQGLSLLARNTRAIQESVMRLRSMPISVVFNRFPRLVHDLGAKLGKKVDLMLLGQTTEIDKMVLEKISDPLVHLVRNALDHGLESPEERAAAGKPETGVLKLDAYHQGSDIVVHVSDDGRGIDRERVLRKAREVGLVKLGEELSDEAVRNLIFAPGFSTAATVTDVSGRGVGMDVVREGVKALGGDVSVTSTPGTGTRITLRLPLTLAIIDGQLVRVGQYLYVVPLLSIVESVEVDPSRVSPHEHGSRLYRLRDDFIPMIDPASLLGASAGVGEQKLMVIVEGDKGRVGLLVDELLAQQQVVVKSLESNYGRVEGLAGATVVGEGSVSLILDVTGISRMARTRQPSGKAA